MGQFGRCINIDCAHYDEEIEIEVGGEMVCPHCGQPLEPVPGQGKGPGLPPDPSGIWKKIAIGVGIAAVLGGGGYGCYALLGGGDKAPAEKETLVSQFPKDTTATTTDTVTTPPANDGDGIEKGDGGKEKTTTSVQTKKPDVSTTSKHKDKDKDKTSPRPTGINLGYGIYRGESRNGQPHGHGTITYTRSHRIVASKDFVANPGDKFEGEFRDGMVSGGMGYWYHDGDITAVKP